MDSNGMAARGQDVCGPAGVLTGGRPGEGEREPSPLWGGRVECGVGTAGSDGKDELGHRLLRLRGLTVSDRAVFRHED